MIDSEFLFFTFRATLAQHKEHTHQHNTIAQHINVTWLFAGLLMICTALGATGLSSTAYALESSTNTSVLAEHMAQTHVSSAATSAKPDPSTADLLADTEQNTSAPAKDSPTNALNEATDANTAPQTNTATNTSDTTTTTTSPTTNTNNNTSTSTTITVNPASSTSDTNAAQAPADSQNNSNTGTTKESKSTVATPQTTTNTTANKQAQETTQSEYVSVEEGTYIIESEYGTVLDVLGAGSADGTNVQAYTDNATGAQRFIIKAAGADKNGNIQYEILAQDSGKALDVFANINADGTNVQIYSRNATNAQRWYFKKSTDKNGKTYYVIVGVGSQKALDVAGSGSGANVRIVSLNGKASQNWALRACPLPTEFASIENGVYIIESEYGTVLDVLGAGSADGTNVHVYENNQTIAQRFYINKAGADNQGNPLYTISSVVSAKAVDVFAASNHDGTNVQIYQQNGTPAQTWRLVPSFTANGTPCFVVMSSVGVKALDVAGSGSGANVRIWNLNGSTSQKWIFRACTATIEDGAYVIENGTTGFAIDIANQSGSNGANAHLWQKHGANSQAFALNYDSYTGYYAITNYGSGKLLDAQAGGVENRTNVWQYELNRTAAQLWRVVVNADNTVSFFSAKSGLALTVDGNAQNGANIMIYESVSGNSQRFSLLSANPSIAAGYFNIVDGEAGSYVWDIPAGSTKQGVRAGLYESNNTIAQKYVLESSGDGYWYIRPVISGQYVSVDSNGAVTQQNQSANYTQKWSIVATNNGHFTLAEAKSGALIGVDKLSNGVSLYAAANAKHANWNFVKTSLLTSGYYVIHPKANTNISVEVYYNGLSSGTNIDAWYTEDHNSQKFYIQDLGNNTYTVYGGWSTLPWDVQSAQAKAGTNIWQYSSNGTDAQKWTIEWHNGGFFFKSALGNYALSLNSLDAGANAQLDTYNTSSANQCFLLNHTSLTRASVSDLISVLDFYASGNELKSFKSLHGLSSDTIDAIWDALYGFWDIGTSVGFTLIDLTTGAGVTYNSDIAYFAACTIKAPYSLALSEYVPSSLSAYGDEIWCALDYSDNETYMSYFYDYGTWPLDNYNSIAHVENFTWQSWLASYSAEDLCRMWVVSQDYLLGSSSNAAWFRDVLSNNTAQMTRSAVANYGAGPVYAKTGWTDNARTEGCLVMDGDHPYVCAIMSTTNIEHSYLLSNLADALYRAHRDLIV